MADQSASTLSNPNVSPKKFKLDFRYYAPMFITCVLLVAHYNFGVLEHWSFTAAAILTSMAVELV
ncbi:MAG: hypothetical protein ABJA67_04995, partial [Chthonomonadales bacterium]